MFDMFDWPCSRESILGFRVECLGFYRVYTSLQVRFSVRTNYNGLSGASKP